MKTITIDRKLHTINAEGQSIGRIATAVVEKLIGKHKTSYQPHIDSGDFVTVKNITKVKFTGKKFDQKIYYRHTGYPGGIKSQNLNKLFTNAPEKVLEKAVYNMLPKNRLRAKRLKRLTIK